ncbi:DUF885 domain-containing protein [Rhodopirellula sp. MGV]|uniref:DUF885 domain-containing protein n=1 Tax=Rhodopirellula sp. MGV TaxID=2023130 RepID=UPI000B96652F|nr:DUF885 domain-containing protein [Rhodopirellula sp. MGV]OYP36120.1 hypothetical protein CGZ80_10300 [Rhodopirellula sp. MGV]PNY36521.1 DUF885 domain-containing protein [Rhodopirellula baltica]
MRMFRMILVGILLGSLGLAAAAADNPAVIARPSNPELRELMDEVWEFELSEYPMLATDVGDPRGQDRLASNTLEDFKRRDEERSKFLDKLSSIDFDQLPAADRIDAELLQQKLSSERSDYQLGLHLMPINNREGFHIGLPELPHTMNPDSPDDFRNYIARLREFPRFVDEQIDLMRGGLKAGMVQPAIIMRDSADQAAAHVVDDPEQSLFLTNISEESIKKLAPGQWEQLRPAILEAIKTSVVPSYAKFERFLRDEYVPGCSGSIAARALPNGMELYQSQVTKFTTLAMTPEELHQTGVRENARIRQEMEAVKTRVNFDGSLAEFIEFLRTDEQFYPKTPEELMKEAAYILKQADGRLPNLFGKLPRTPCGIRQVPDYVAPQTTSAYYWPPAADGSRGGFYYLNTYNLSARPLYQLEALSLHEAVPGHHLQLALQAELEGLHPIRKQSYFSAFIEGWALYCERLGSELGFFKDPYQEFGRLSMEAWRASRLVVDTGIHAKGWTREQAINYMLENTALSKHNVVAEVDRYIGWPGQALSYKVGELFIRDLRERAEKELGDRFDVRAFHDCVLKEGSVPLPVLEKQVAAWIEETASGN